MSIPMITIADKLKNALSILHRTDCWRAILAENLNWASCEPLFQSSLLWAFNTQPESDIMADRERAIAGTSNKGTKPDLLVFRKEDRAAWCAATSSSPRDRLTLRRLGLGFVYMKVVWSEGIGEGSAKIRSKAIQIADDINKARKILVAVSEDGGISAEKQLYLVVLLVSFERDMEKGAASIEVCENQLSQAVTKRLLEVQQAPYTRVDECWLLKGQPIPSQIDWLTFAKAILLDISDRGLRSTAVETSSSLAADLC
jgi:hypothetical protein